MSKQENTTTADSIHKEVESILESAGVTFSATYRGETELDGRTVDAWSCAFTKGWVAYEEFDFYTGLGCRKAPTWGQEGASCVPPPRPGTLLYEQWIKDAKPLRPLPADVLYSLLLDAAVVGQSFESWCDEYGYNPYSHKTEADYTSCRENAIKLARVFNTEQHQALEIALKDY